MIMLDKEKVLQDLKLMRQCADAYCPDHDCKHCKLAIDQDEKVKVLDMVIPIVESILTGRLCPVNHMEPCVSQCAWYDYINETCSMKRRSA